MRTIDYYNKNAKAYADSTVNSDVTELYGIFEKYLPNDASVLDLGCGSGRDSKYFLEKGYKVTAVDGSKELCKIASDYSGIEVDCKLFQDIDYLDKFDGVWACSSLLHLDRDSLIAVINKVVMALKPNGVFYASFKFGDFEGYIGERFFINFTDESIKDLISNFQNMELLETVTTNDVRPDRQDEKWLNVVFRKC